MSTYFNSLNLAKVIKILLLIFSNYTDSGNSSKTLTLSLRLLNSRYIYLI